MEVMGDQSPADTGVYLPSSREITVGDLKIREKEPTGKRLSAQFVKVIKENRVLLGKNVPVTDQLCLCFEDHGVIKESSRNKITQCKSNDDKMAAILDDIKFENQFENFCDVLLMTGHPMISQYVRDSVGKVDMDLIELWTAFPTLGKNLRQGEKDNMINFLNAKVKEAALTHLMKESSGKGTAAAEIKMKYVEQSWKHVKQLKEKESTSDQLRSEMQQLADQLQRNQKELAEARQTIKKMEQQHSQQMNVSAQYNNASENSLRRLQERFDFHVNAVQFFEAQLLSYAHKLPEKKTEAEDDSADRHSLPDDSRTLKHLKKVFSSFMLFVKELENDRDKLGSLEEEVGYVISQLDPYESEDRTLRGALRAATVHQEQVTTTLQEEITLLQDFINMRLSDDKIPESLKDVSLPAMLKKEYIQQIDILTSEIQSTSQQLHEKILEIEHLANHGRHLSAELKRARDVRIPDLADVETQTEAEPKPPTPPPPPEPPEAPAPPKTEAEKIIADLNAAAETAMVKQTRARGNVVGTVTLRKKPIERFQLPSLPPPLQSDFVLETQSLRNTDSSVVAMAKRRKAAGNVPSLRRSQREAANMVTVPPHTSPVPPLVPLAEVEISPRRSQKQQPVGTSTKLLSNSRPKLERGFPQGIILQTKGLT